MKTKIVMNEHNATPFPHISENDIIEGRYFLETTTKTALRQRTVISKIIAKLDGEYRLMIVSDTWKHGEDGIYTLKELLPSHAWECYILDESEAFLELL